MRRRDPDASSPTGKIAAQMSVAPASSRPCSSAATRGLVADDRRVGRVVDAAVVEDPLVVRELAVDRELLGGDGAGLGDVVVDGDGQAGDDPRRRAPGVGGGLADPRGDVRLDRLGVAHPQDRPVGDRTGDTQQARREGGDEQLHRLGDRLGRRRRAASGRRPSNVDGLAVQQRRRRS